MKILVKFPTRERPEKFINTLKGYYSFAKDNSNIHYMITIDDNDLSMHSPSVNSLLSNYNNVSVHSGISTSKIHAVNRDMHKAPQWDILVLASDDMICQVDGWDNILRFEMAAHYPDTDGCLFHWDGDPATKRHNNGKGLATMCIIGRKYYDRFGYIYHPSYKSLFCDNEYTDVAQQLNKMYFSEEVLFRHVHYTNTPGIQPDNLMKHTQSFYRDDEKTYNKRKQINFGL